MTIRDLKDIPDKKIQMEISQPDWTVEERDYYLKKHLDDQLPTFYDPLGEFTDFISAPIKFVGKLFKRDN